MRVGALREQEAAAALCARLHEPVFGALLLYCGDRDLAEDLTQETLLRVWRRWDAVSGMDSPERWALRVAFNLAKSMLRRRRVAQRAAAFSHVAVASAEDPTDAIVLRGAVAGLPSRQRQVVVLRYFNDLSVAQTAAVLGCAQGTVKALTSQAVAKLRDRLEVRFPDREVDRRA